MVFLMLDDLPAAARSSSSTRPTRTRDLCRRPDPRDQGPRRPQAAGRDEADRARGECVRGGAGADGDQVQARRPRAGGPDPRPRAPRQGLPGPVAGARRRSTRRSGRRRSRSGRATRSRSTRTSSPRRARSSAPTRSCEKLPRTSAAAADTHADDEAGRSHVARARLRVGGVPPPGLRGGITDSGAAYYGQPVDFIRGSRNWACRCSAST